MKISVIGRSPSWQDAGGACSGYLVEEGATRVLLECGSGVFAKLRERMDFRDLDAVVVSHLHADHILDLIPFAYGLKFGAGEKNRGPALHLPPGGLAALRRICGTWGGETLVEEAFATAREYDPADGLAVGELALRFCPVPHFIDAWAVSLSGRGSGSFVYGSDCGPSAQLAEFAEGAELLMLEATFPEGDPGIGPEDANPGHLSGGQAGELARQASAGRLVLTHASADFDLESSVRAASEAFGGPVDLAAEDAGWEI